MKRGSTETPEGHLAMVRDRATAGTFSSAELCIHPPEAALGFGERALLMLVVFIEVLAPILAGWDGRSCLPWDPTRGEG